MRLKGFNPSRGTLAAFARTVIRHDETRCVARFKPFETVSLDQPIYADDGVSLGDTFATEDGYLAWIGPYTSPITTLEHQLCLDRARAALEPEHLRLCADLVSGSIGSMAAGRGPSRATLYRQLDEIRLRLLAAGARADRTQPSTRLRTP